MHKRFSWSTTNIIFALLDSKQLNLKKKERKVNILTTNFSSKKYEKQNS